MVITFKENTKTKDIQSLIDFLITSKINYQKLGYLNKTVIIIKDKIGHIDFKTKFAFIADVLESEYPFKLINRQIFKEDYIVEFNDQKIGNNQKIAIIAGPCSIESEESLSKIATHLKSIDVNILRGGAFKPRTSPYAFLGLEAEGLEILKKVKKSKNINTISELLDFDDYGLYIDSVDIIQIGARNMQNFSLLKKLGQIDKPVLLKRGFSNTIEEWLLAAEYIVSHGNPNVILCERGIRTFEPYTRNSLDLSVINIVKSICNLPIIVDPSHATGSAELVVPMALAAIVAGVDGIMLEVSENPKDAISDGFQTIDLETFSDFMEKAKKLATFLGREI